MRVQPAQRRPGASVGDGAADHCAGDRRGDGAVAADIGRRVVTAEQRFIREDQVDRDRESGPSPRGR